MSLISNLDTLVSISDLETILDTVPELVPYSTIMRSSSSSSSSSSSITSSNESGGEEVEYYDFDESFADLYIFNNGVSQLAAAYSTTSTSTKVAFVVDQARYCTPASFQVLQRHSLLYKSDSNLACIDMRRSASINHLIKRKRFSLKNIKTSIINSISKK